MRYRLRTLLILLAIAPPVLAGLWFAAPSLEDVVGAALGLAFWTGVAAMFFIGLLRLAWACIDEFADRRQ